MDFFSVAVFLPIDAFIEFHNNSNIVTENRIFIRSVIC